jgi:hypothetical protein
MVIKRFSQLMLSLSRQYREVIDSLHVGVEITPRDQVDSL